MTVKAFNELRSQFYAAAMEDAEIREAVEVSGVAHVFELEQLPDRHAVLVLTARTQLNDSTIRAQGFDPAAVQVRHRFSVSRQRRTVLFD